MIIQSLLDTDFYKLTMMQTVFHKYTNIEVEYKFSWRNWSSMELNTTIDNFVNHLEDEIDNGLCELRFTEDELEYLSTISFIKKDFIEFLRLFKLNRNHVEISNNGSIFDIRIKGPWLNTILFEVPILSIISELYTEFKYTHFSDHISNGLYNLEDKLNLLNQQDKDNDFKYGDFGTRRRASFGFQEASIEHQLEYEKLIGTSNVYFAKQFNIKPLGTHAHEWFQAHQQLNSRLINSQKDALQSWANEYRGDLGIALSDCITFGAFLVDFDKYFAKLFDGCRHDSGNPFEWTEKLINHYENLGINSKTKTALFSDGLTLGLALELHNKFKNRINTAFGIGTNLTNDCGFKAPQIVIKMVKCNNLPVAKISDSPGKGMCEDIEFENYLKKVILQKLGKDF
ncbi:MAG: nicotinate phosphoribosyltransferase [bacterium]